MLCFRVFVCVMILLGAVMQLKLAWGLADLCMTFMALINIYAILKLRKFVLAALVDYRRQKRRGKDPVFGPYNVRRIKHAEAWVEEPEW